MSIVLCEYGAIHITWKKVATSELSFQINLPKESKAVLCLPLSQNTSSSTISINGKTYLENRKIMAEGKIDGSYFILPMTGALYEGIVSG